MAYLLSCRKASLFERASFRFFGNQSQLKALQSGPRSSMPMRHACMRRARAPTGHIAIHREACKYALALKAYVRPVTRAPLPARAGGPPIDRIICVSAGCMPRACVVPDDACVRSMHGMGGRLLCPHATLPRECHVTLIPSHWKLAHALTCTPGLLTETISTTLVLASWPGVSFCTYMLR